MIAEDTGITEKKKKNTTIRLQLQRCGTSIYMHSGALTSSQISSRWLQSES